MGAQHCALGLHALWGLRAVGLVGNGPWGGWPATVVRGVWFQALSLSRLPVPRGGQPGFNDPCVPGAVGVGVGTRPLPDSVRPCGPALRAAGVAEGRPRGGCLSPLLGASEVRRSPSPDCPPSGRAVGVRYQRAVGPGVRVSGPSTVPLACMPFGGCVPRGWRRAVPVGAGLPLLLGASGVRRCPSLGRPSSGAGSRGCCLQVDVAVTSDYHRVPSGEAALRDVHLDVGPECRLPCQEGAARLRPVDADESKAPLVRADFQGGSFTWDNFPEAKHLMLGHVLAADSGVEATRPRAGDGFHQPAAEEGDVPLVPECCGYVVLCAQVAISDSRRITAKPCSRGSIPVTKCSLSVQATGPRCRWRVSLRERSCGTRPLCRIEESSPRTSSAASSWIQLSCTGGGEAGYAGAARSWAVAGARESGEPASKGAHSPALMEP